MTNEQPLVHQALARRNIALRTLEIVTGFGGGHAAPRPDLHCRGAHDPRAFARHRRPAPARLGAVRRARGGSSVPFAAPDGRCQRPRCDRPCRLSGPQDGRGAWPHAHSARAATPPLRRATSPRRRNDRTPHPRRPPRAARHGCDSSARRSASPTAATRRPRSSRPTTWQPFTHAALRVLAEIGHAHPRPARPCALRSAPGRRCAVRRCTFDPGLVGQRLETVPADVHARGAQSAAIPHLRGHPLASLPRSAARPM